MRLFITNLLATALVLFGAASASASSLNLTSDYAGGPVTVGTLINIELEFDATTTGVQLLSVGFLFDNTVLGYVPQTNLSVGVPSYILYGMSGMVSTSLYAQQASWLLWPGAVPPGQSQVNVNWADATFNGTFVTGSNVIARIQFQVLAVGDGIGEINMTLTAGGNIYQVSGNPLSPITLTGGQINVITPEPTTAVLVGLGLAGLAVAGRRR
jgi:hypothetical protein